MDRVKTRSKLTAAIAPEASTAEYRDGRDGPTRDQIARLAYHFYEERGRQSGHDVDDWLAAEQELNHHYR